jgi:hypothetical protein
VPPQLRVQSVGLQATVSWNSGGGCAPTSYVLLAGSAPGLSDVAQASVGGQLALSANAPAGTYYVRVVGTNAYGSAVSQELTIRMAPNAQTDTVAPNGAVFVDVMMTVTGTYTGTLVWNDAAIDLDLYLTTVGCSYPPTGCLLSISDTVGSATEQVSRSVAAGESYRLWVDNFSTQTTSFTIINTVGAADAQSASDERQLLSFRGISKVKP